MKLVFSGSAKFAECKNIKKKMFMFLFCFLKTKNCLILDILILNFALPKKRTKSNIKKDIAIF